MLVYLHFTRLFCGIRDCDSLFLSTLKVTGTSHLVLYLKNYVIGLPGFKISFDYIIPEMHVSDIRLHQNHAVGLPRPTARMSACPSRAVPRNSPMCFSGTAGLGTALGEPPSSVCGSVSRAGLYGRSVEAIERIWA